MNLKSSINVDFDELLMKTSIEGAEVRRVDDTNFGKDSDNNRIFLSSKERKKHTHVIGSTGKGKSKCLEYMIRQDIERDDCGLCLIDPHGKLYDDVLAYISQYPRLAEKVVLFNPAEDSKYILGFNPVPTLNNNLDYASDMLVSACLKAWGQDSTDETPRISRILDNIFYALMVNGMTLVEAVPLISTTKYSKPLRKKFYDNIRDMNIREDWEQFESAALREKQNLMEGAGNRLRKFVRNEIIRNIIGTQTKKLDLYSIMEEGKILLVNLDGQASLSNDNTKLLGVMLVNEIFRLSKSRNEHDPKLKPFYCYIDEFGQFVTRDIARALEECRKYGLFMVLAHQHLEQLKKDDDYLYATVMGICQNKIVFGGLSVEDSNLMAEDINRGYYDHLKVKYQHEMRAWEPVRKFLPVFIESWEDFSESGESASVAFTQKFNQSREKAFTQATLENISVTETEIQSICSQIASSLREARTESDIQSIAKQISDTSMYTNSNIISNSKTFQTGRTRREVSSRSEMQNTVRQMANSIINAKSNSNSRSIAKQLINTMSKSNIYAKAHNITKQLADTFTQIDTHSDVQAMTNQIFDTVTDIEGTTDTHSETAQVADIERDSEANIKERIDTRSKNNGSSNVRAGDKINHINTSQLNNSVANSVRAVRAKMKEHMTSHATADSFTRALSKIKAHQEGEMESDSKIDSHAEAQSKQQSDIISDAVTESVNESLSEQQSDILNEMISENFSETEARQKTDSIAHTISEGISEIMEEFESHIVSNAVSNVVSNSEIHQNSIINSRQLGSTFSKSSELQKMNSFSNMLNNAVSKSFGALRQHSETERESVNDESAVSKNLNSSSGKKSQRRKTWSWEVIHEEFSQKQAPNFFTLEELKELKAAEIKIQDKAVAFMKMDGKPPVQVKIDYIPNPDYNELLAEKIERFQELVYEKNPQYYTADKELRKEVYERQKKFFGEPLELGDKETYEKSVDEEETAESWEEFGDA